MQLQIQNKLVVDESDWSYWVECVTGKHYRLQQQDGCRDRGVEYLKVPSEWSYDHENDEIEVAVNGEEMGVSLKAWLARKPEDKFFADARKEQLFWERNFYPELGALANYLHEQGLLPAGHYMINIDW